MNSLEWIIVGGLLMSSIALVGGLTTVMRPATLERLILPLVSLAAGTLLGGAVLHMIPPGFAALASRRFHRLSRSRAIPSLAPLSPCLGCVP